MTSEKASYWVAVGVLALVVSNSLADRHNDWTVLLAGRSIATVQRVSGQVMRYAAIAELIFRRGGAAFAGTQTATAHARLAWHSCKQLWPTEKLS